MSFLKNKDAKIHTKASGAARAASENQGAQQAQGTDTAPFYAAPRAASVTRRSQIVHNQASASRLHVQAKMSVSVPGEPAEAEADTVADAVMRMPAPAAATPASTSDKSDKASASRLPRLANIRPPSVPSVAPVIPVAARAVSPSSAEPAADVNGGGGNVDAGADSAPAVSHALSGGGGAPLDASARSFLEPRMGHDLSDVRVHTGERAAKSAQAVNAQAYTVGRDVVFGAGAYQPGSSAGRKLLAHELTHVVQQTGGARRKSVARKPGAAFSARHFHRTVSAPETAPQKKPGEKSSGRNNAPASDAPVVAVGGEKTAKTAKNAAPHPAKPANAAAKHHAGAKTRHEAHVKNHHVKGHHPKKQRVTKSARSHAPKPAHRTSHKHSPAHTPHHGLMPNRGPHHTPQGVRTKTRAAHGGAQVLEQSNKTAVPTLPNQPTGRVFAADDAAAALFPASTFRLGRTANQLNLLETDAPPPVPAAQTALPAQSAPNPAPLAPTASAPANAAPANAAPLVSRRPAAAKNARLTVFPVPQATANQMGAQQRQKAQALLSDFVSQQQSRIQSVGALGTSIEPQLQAAAASASQTIDAAAQQGHGQIAGAASTAKAALQTRAESARARLHSDHDQTVEAIKAQTLAAKQQAEQDYQAELVQIAPLVAKNTAGIDAPFNQSLQALNAKAEAFAAQGAAVAREAEAAYANQTPPESGNAVGKWLESWDRETFVANWHAAKATAAQKGGSDFSTQMRGDAAQMGGTYGSVKNQLAAGFTNQGERARTDMGTQHAAALAALDQKEAAQVQAASQLLSAKLTDLDAKQHAAEAGIEQTVSAQQAAIDAAAAQKKGAATQASQTAAVTLHQGIAEAQAGLQNQLQSFGHQVSQMPRPQAASFRVLLAGAKTEFDNALNAAQTQIPQSLTAAVSRVSEQGTGGASAVNRAAQTGLQALQTAPATFGGQMDAAAQEGTAAFSQIKTAYAAMLAGERAQAKAKYQNRLDALNRGFAGATARQSELIANVEAQYAARAQAQMGTLRPKIDTAAAAAAAQVQPAWKTIAKIVVGIVISVVVAVAIAGLAVTGVGLILAAFAIGAVGGIVTQGINDLIDGKEVGFNKETGLRYGMAALSGGIGGAAGAGGNMLSASLIKGGGALVSSAGRQFATTLGIDTLGTMTGGVADAGMHAVVEGQPITLQSLGMIALTSFGSALLGKGAQGLIAKFKARGGGTAPHAGGETGGETLPSVAAPEGSVHAAPDAAPAAPTAAPAASEIAPAPASPKAEVAAAGETLALPAAKERLALPAHEEPKLLPSGEPQANAPASHGQTPAEVPGLETRGYKPAPGERGSQARADYEAGRQSGRQADFDRFKAEQTQKLRAANPNFTPEELQSLVANARRAGRLSSADAHRMRYLMDAPTGRAADIDRLAGENYQRMLERQLAQSDTQYRYTTDKVVNGSPGRDGYRQTGRIERPTYMTDTKFDTNAQSMDAAQVAKDWGVHDTRLEVPTSELVDPRIVRPFGDSAHVKRGWEPFTNSYPEYGRGGALQYKAGTRSFEDGWVHPLENTFGAPKASGPRTGGPEVTPGLETRGYKPAPGERTTTRGEWKAQQSRSRAEATVAKADQPLETLSPNTQYPNPQPRQGHGHARHGSQTTSAEQASAVRSGARPDGTNNGPIGTASRFRTPEAEAEALGRGRKLLEEKLRSGTLTQNQLRPDPVTGVPTYVNPVTGKPTRITIKEIPTNDARGYGDGFVAETDPATNQMVHPDPANPTHQNPVPNPVNPLEKAQVTYEYVPSTGKWESVTHYATP